MAVIQKWGNSLGVRIPAAMAEELKVSAGTPIELKVADGSILVTPRRRPRYRLKDLLKNCKPHQLHGELDFGPDVGREVID
ncbi:MAG TPA: AbrB/MazE/SpoVT family DNA-binding domain-containing protein [Planctomycetaceae bacterium]|nr:AbrB/MazE/SpoVT family DNA-binding domain-containing protein [Planctomycetaceae bacterium]